MILTAPGEEGQVDYGSGPMVRDPQSGKYRRTRLFVLTLGYSRKAVRLLTFRSSTCIWAELHEKAFRRLGGAPRIVVLDNLREGVLVPDVYDATLNPLYRDVLAHYGAIALPCRIQDPDRADLTMPLNLRSGNAFLGSSSTPKRIAPVAQFDARFLIHGANPHRVLLFAIPAAPQVAAAPLARLGILHLVYIDAATANTARRIAPAHRL